MNLLNHMRTALTKLFSPKSRVPKLRYQHSVQVLKPNPQATVSPLPKSADAPSVSKALPLDVAPEVLARFTDTHKNLVWTYIFTAVERAVMQDIPEVFLFRLTRVGQTAAVQQQNYEDTLRMMSSHFLETEQYEKVQRCRDLIDKIHIKRLLKESTEM